MLAGGSRRTEVRGRVATFRSDDEAIAHWLAQLRDSNLDTKIAARTELGLILEQRGLIDDAIDAYGANVAAEARDPRPYERLAAIYRARGDAASERSVREALGRMLARSDEPKPSGMPLAALPSAHATPETAQPLRATNRSPGPARESATAPRRREPRQSRLSARMGFIVALLGIMALVAALVFAMLWAGVGVGGQSESGSDRVGTGRDVPPAVQPATVSGTTGMVGAVASPSPTVAAQEASCWDAALRFPPSRQPAESVRQAMLDYLRRQTSALDPEAPRVKTILDAHVARADDLMAGWMGVQLQWARRGLDASKLSLTSYVGSELLIPNEGGQYTLRASITPAGWQEMQAWPVDTCEGAFMQRPENAAWVERMKASVGSTAWASALPSPATASPSPSPSLSPSPATR